MVPEQSEDRAFDAFGVGWAELLLGPDVEVGSAAWTQILELLAQLDGLAVRRRREELPPDGDWNFRQEHTSADPAHWDGRLSVSEKELIDCLSLLVISGAMTHDAEPGQLNLLDTPQDVRGRVFVSQSMSDGVDDGCHNLLIEVTRLMAPFFEVVVPQPTPAHGADEIRLRNIARVASADLVVAIDQHDSPGVAVNVTTALANVVPVVRVSTHEQRRAGSKLMASGAATALQFECSAGPDDIADQLRLGLGHFGSQFLYRWSARSVFENIASQRWLGPTASVWDNWADWIASIIRAPRLGRSLTVQQAQMFARLRGLPATGLLNDLVDDAAAALLPLPRTLRAAAPAQRDYGRTATLSAEEILHFVEFSKSEPGQRLSDEQLQALLEDVQQARARDGEFEHTSLRIQLWNATAWRKRARELGFLA